MTIGKLEEHYNLWIAVFVDLSNGGTGLKYFDALQIPVGGFKENYSKFIEDGDTHLEAWRKAMEIQFEKRLDEQQ